MRGESDQIAAGSCASGLHHGCSVFYPVRHPTGSSEPGKIRTPPAVGLALLTETSPIFSATTVRDGVGDDANVTDPSSQTDERPSDDSPVQHCPWCGEHIGSFWGRRGDDGSHWCEACQRFFRVEAL
jgi:hypothetical protein